MSRFVRMTHKDHGGTALIPAAAVAHNEANGWQVTDVPEPPDEPAPEPDTPKRRSRTRPASTEE